MDVIVFVYAVGILIVGGICWLRFSGRKIFRPYSEGAFLGLLSWD